MLAHRWWSYVVRGGAAIGFGVSTLLSPSSSVATLLLLFRGFALVNGAFTLVTASRGRLPHRGCLIFEGVASIVAGLLTFPGWGRSPLVLLFLIAAWSVATGVSAVIAAIRVRRHLPGEWLLALSGGISVAFGLLLFLLTSASGLLLVIWDLFPILGTPALMLWIGVYAIVLGGLLLALGLRLKGWKGAPDQGLPSGGKRLLVPHDSDQLRTRT